MPDVNHEGIDQFQWAWEYVLVTTVEETFCVECKSVYCFYILRVYIPLCVSYPRGFVGELREDRADVGRARTKTANTGR